MGLLEAKCAILLTILLITLRTMCANRILPENIGWCRNINNSQSDELAARGQHGEVLCSDDMPEERSTGY